jgi:hypothetical protein
MPGPRWVEGGDDYCDDDEDGGPAPQRRRLEEAGGAAAAGMSEQQRLESSGRCIRNVIEHMQRLGYGHLVDHAFRPVKLYALFFYDARSPQFGGPRRMKDRVYWGRGRRGRRPQDQTGDSGGDPHAYARYLYAGVNEAERYAQLKALHAPGVIFDWIKEGFRLREDSLLEVDAPAAMEDAFTAMCEAEHAFGWERCRGGACARLGFFAPNSSQLKTRGNQKTSGAKTWFF